MTSDLQATIDAAWEGRDGISPATKGAARDAIEAALDLLDSGEARVAEKGPDGWRVNQWLKKAVLLSFRSEEHTSELQSLMRISYAVFCLKKKQKNKRRQ